MVWADERDGGTESGGNVGRKHREPVPVGEIGSKGLIMRGLVVAKMKNTSRHCQDGA